MLADEVRRRLHGAGRRSSGCSRCTSTRRRRAAGRRRRGRVPHRRDARDRSTRRAARCARLRALAGGVPLTGFSLARSAGARAAIADRGVAARLRDAGLDGDRRSAARSVRRSRPRRSTPRVRRPAGLRADRAVAPPSDLLASRSRSARDAPGARPAAFARSRRCRGSCRSPTPTTGYDDVKLVALARLVCRDIAVDPGGLAALRPEARAGRR